MNPTIIALCVAVGAGVLAGLVVALRLRAIKVDVLIAHTPPTPWQRQLTAWNREDAELRKARAAEVAVRADTLRGIYLADLAAADREEVPAQ